jgi:tryptophanyl-tRNA synthetase
MRKRVFSGIQPTGEIHIGRYVGAIRNWVDMQKDYDNIICVVDLHAITVQQDPGLLKDRIREFTGLLLACGIDPEKSILFIQSHVAAHAEMAWILNCFIPIGWMQRMTQYKEKSQKQKEQASTGLFAYPSLMAADILLYDTDTVPVGEDQKQHVELTRDVAQRFNSIYGETFKLPEPLISDIGARIMGLDDPTKKMSGSESGTGHSIGLLDPADEIRSKIMKSTTDSLREIRFDEARPGIFNLLSIYQSFTDLPDKEIEARFEGKGYGELKKELTGVVIDSLQPIQERYRKITAESGYIDKVVKEGADKARPMAEKKLAQVHNKVGLG